MARPLATTLKPVLDEIQRPVATSRLSDQQSHRTSIRERATRLRSAHIPWIRLVRAGTVFRDLGPPYAWPPSAPTKTAVRRADVDDAMWWHTPRGSLLEDDLDPAYISALSALAGATIGGLTSFATSWTTQRTQLRHAHREAERAKLEALYSDFITEAARLYGDALTHQTEEITGLVQLYAMVGRMRLISDRAVVVAAVQVEDTIVATYLGPNRTLHEMMDIAHKGAMNFLTEFGEASKKDLAARAVR